MFKSYILLFFICLAGNSHSQYALLDSIRTIEPLEKKLEYLGDITNRAVYADTRQALESATLYDSLSQSLENPIFRARALNMQGMAHYVNGMYDQSFDYYVEALKLEDYLENRKERARLRNNLATVTR